MLRTVSLQAEQDTTGSATLQARRNSAPTIDSTSLKDSLERASIHRDTINLAGEWKFAPIDDTASSDWRSQPMPNVVSMDQVVNLRKYFILPKGAKDRIWKLELGYVPLSTSVFCNGTEISIGLGRQSMQGKVDVLLPKSCLIEGRNHLDLIQDPARSAKKGFPLRATSYDQHISPGISGALLLTSSDAPRIVRTEIVTDQNSSVLRCFVGGDLSGLHVVATKSDGGNVESSGSPKGNAQEGQYWDLPLSQPSSDWSLDAPTLSTIRCQLYRESELVDETLQHTGISSIGLNNGVLQNAGASLTFHAVRYVPTSSVKNDLLSIRSLGLNAIRVTALPEQQLLDLCDSLGLGVLLEAPLSEANGTILAKEDVSSLYRSYLKDLVQAAAGHACVIGYGLGVGFDDWKTPTRDLLSQTAQYVRSLDPRRLIYYVTEDPNSTFALDLAVLSMRPQLDDEQSRQALEKFALIHRGKQPVLVFDLGTNVSEGHQGITDPLSQEAQAKAVSNGLFTCNRLGYAGVALSAYRDFPTGQPVLLSDNDDRQVSTSGLLDAHSKQRLSYAAVQSSLAGGKSPNLQPAEMVQEGSWGFLIYGIALLILFFALMNADRRFREYVGRSIVRSFNFFADVRDQRLIPNAQTTILAIVISGTFAVTYGGLLFAFRMHPVAERFMLRALPWRSADSWLFDLAWHPMKLMTEFTLLYLVTIVVIAGIARFAAIFVKGRIFYSDTYNVTVWAFLPAVIMLPVGMLIPRLDRTETMVFVIGVVLILLGLWLFFRLLKGIAVLFDIYPTRIYLYGTLSLAVVVVLGLMVIEHRSALFEHYAALRHLASVW